MDPMNSKDRAQRAPAKKPAAAGKRPARATQPRAARAPQVSRAPETSPEEQGYAFADVVSGALDADEAREDLEPTKRVLQPEAQSPKLHKVLAQAGMGSRLEMEQMILEGRISVNNEPAHVGQRVQFGDQIKVNGKPIHFRIEPPPARVIAYHKPVGEVVTHDDPQNRPTVFRKLPRLHNGKWQSVGRLDLNTEGLLLLTSSGALANNLMHPRFGLEREYAVRVLGALSKEEKQRLIDGVQLEDGEAAFGSIEDGGGEGANCWYRVTISEGRNREVRRMFEAVGHAVSRLIRIRYGAMVLPKGLKRGAWLELDEKDIAALMKAAGAAAPQPAARDGAPLRRSNPDRATGRRAGPGASRPQPARRFQENSPGERTRPARSGALFAEESKARRDGGGGKAQQPDPLKTSVNLIGRDSLERYRAAQKKNSGGGRRGGR